MWACARGRVARGGDEVHQQQHAEVGEVVPERLEDPRPRVRAEPAVEPEALAQRQRRNISENLNDNDNNISIAKNAMSTRGRMDLRLWHGQPDEAGDGGADRVAESMEGLALV